MITVDRTKIRKLVNDWLQEQFDDEPYNALHTNLCDTVMEGITEPNTDWTDEEWDKVEVLIDEAVGECRAKITELLTSTKE